MEILDTKSLKQERKAAGMSARQLSIRLGMDPSYISKVERGRRTPSLKVLVRIRKILPGLRLPGLVEVA